MTANAWKSWLLPGGLLLALSVALVNSSLLQLVAPSLGFYYLAVFTAGLLLAWRFNSSRVLFSLLVILLAHRAVEFFSAGRLHSGSGRTAIILVALLVPLNYIALALMRERGFTVAGMAPRFGILFLESVVVAVACRPENSSGSSAAASGLPLWTLISFAAGATVLVLRFFQTRKPMEPGFLWSLVAVFLWLDLSPVGKIADVYVATAGLILAASMVETSYVLAYFDELTGIRGRRAFNESLLSLDQQYAIAIVDIDHFKNFNDTYGHDTGDQVLRMVASRLASVGGGGQAFRCGGEEFAILFRNASAKEAFEELERLRHTIQNSTFRFRGHERRTEPRAAEPERRKPGRKKALAVTPPQRPAGELSVTVSIGVAEPSTRYRQPEQVIHAADQALYRAKHNGRNRVELASNVALRVTRGKGAKASRV
ncbi:MAG: GGDEF domain-containing protein [Acidobacteria bacterium]|nr:GGDEF domain-containing protein [Acidobacteriota bacterium]